VVAILHQRYLDVGALHLLSNAQRDLPRHVGIGLAMEQPHRAVQRDRGGQKQMVAAVLDQGAGDGGGIPIAAGNMDDAAFHDARALLEVQRLPHQQFGEVQGGGDADQGSDSFLPRKRAQHGNPTTHGRSDQDQRSLGQAVDRGQCVRGPDPDGAILELAAAAAVAGIIEAKHGMALLGTERRQSGCLVAGHIATITREENDSGCASLCFGPGQFDAVAAIQPPAACHALFVPCCRYGSYINRRARQDAS
jgi:hypothetical protein